MAFEKYSLSGLLVYTVPLYAAPVLAGMAAATWTSVPIFVLLFSALILKTRKLPAEPAHLMISLLITLTVNTAIVSILFGLGHLGARMTQPLALPLWAPVLICVAATAFGIWRYRWTPQAEEMEAFLTDTLQQIERLNAQDTNEDTENHPLD